MYNGIGLTSARGSGTSGYVQKNLSTLNKSKQKHEYRTEEDIARMEAALNRPANQDILEHQKKRKIEGKVYEERIRLEDEG
jgi:serine/arginine repetitive matrix protein 2